MKQKDRVRKRPGLRGRLSDFPNHSMNSLRSNRISYFGAWLKPRLNDDSENPTASKDLFVRNVFERFIPENPHRAPNPYSPEPGEAGDCCWRIQSARGVIFLPHCFLAGSVSEGVRSIFSSIP